MSKSFQNIQLFLPMAELQIFSIIQSLHYSFLSFFFFFFLPILTVYLTRTKTMEEADRIEITTI